MPPTLNHPPTDGIPSSSVHMSSAAAVSSHAFVPHQQRAAGVVGPTRHLEMVASPARRDRRELATPAAQALQPHRRRESANPLGAALARVVAMEIPAKKEKAVSAVNYEELAWELEHASPLDIMEEMFGGDTKIAFSGVEDVALIEYAWLTGRPFRDFSLKRPETCQFFDAVEKHYDIRIEYMFPDALEVQALIRNKGLFSFYEDGHQECCRVSKRALKGLKTWFTGQRKDQSPRTRANSSVVQVDPSLDGLSGGAPSMIKWNPVNVEGNDTWKFLRTMDVPVNTLHSQGYVSIGCEPCMTPVLPGQHEREGRWWWNNAKAKECGLHKGNVIQNFFSVGTKDNGCISPNGDIGTPHIFDIKSIANLTRAGIKNLLKLENRKEPCIT